MLLLTRISVFLSILLLIGCNSAKVSPNGHIESDSVINKTAGHDILDSTTSDYFNLLRPRFTGDLAFNTTAYVEQFWRVVGNEGFNKSIYRIVKGLEEAGYVDENIAKPSERLTYKLIKRPLDGLTWEPRDAKLSIVGDSTPLLEFSSNRNMIYVNSKSTVSDGINAEVVYVNDVSNLKNIDLQNKIVFAEMSAYHLIGAEVFEKGALGILTYDNPDYLQPEKNKTSIQFRHLPTKYADNHWGIALSFQAKEQLKKALKKGAIKLNVSLNTNTYNSEELTVVANIKGSILPNESLVFSAHVQEPGANDNASGVGAQLEMAAVTAQLINENKLDIKRSLSFLWGDEIRSTRRYIDEKEDRNPIIKWGISLDMVGENTAITGGSFLIEKMPDPSAIVTRGNDKHSEWGGSPLNESDMFPHYLNDLTWYIFNKQGEFANWKVDKNPFEGGSDHTPFLDAKIPSVLFWHFTDQFYHTDNDRINKVSQTTLTNVGVSSLVTAYTLVNADAEIADGILNLFDNVFRERIKIEYNLSLRAIEGGSAKEAEIAILNNWMNWYLKSCESVRDMTQNTAVELEKKIGLTQKSIETLGNDLINKLKDL